MLADVVLIHGFTGAATAWERVLGHLPDGLTAHPVRLAGHEHGPPLGGAAPTIELLTDRVVEALDRAGLDRPHVAGNSLGAWIGLEVAARGRAASLLGLAPAGFWRPGAGLAFRRRVFARQEAAARRLRPLLPALYALGPVRRFALREMAVHGERVTRDELLRATDGMLACEAHPALHDHTGEGARHFDDLPCPVRLLLPEHDRLFPPERYAPRARERVPQARVDVLPGVGHVPMFDDPALVAREIAGWVGSAGG
jgi:pimeloyl-ACP methyl ester carboxylesterase